jgi:hypothetical protein
MLDLNMVGSSGEYLRNTSISLKHKYLVQQSPEELASSEKVELTVDFKSSRPGNKMKEPLHRLQQENKAKLGCTISQHMCRLLYYTRNGIVVRKFPMVLGSLLLRITEGEKRLTTKNVQSSRQYLRISVDFGNRVVAFRASFLAGGGGGSMREYGVDHVA